MSQLGSPLERGQWFDPAIAAVLDQAHVVLKAQHPRALERLTSQLIGAQLHQVLVAEKAGLWFDRWFVELVSATESRVREQADGGAWEVPFRLLHGLAAIGTPDAAQPALAAANRLRKVIGRVPGQDAGPRWPLDVRQLRADGDVVRLRDVGGTRYAVIASAPCTAFRQRSAVCSPTSRDAPGRSAIWACSASSNALTRRWPPCSPGTATCAASAAASANGI
jgi:hypothetical protein